MNHALPSISLVGLLLLAPLSGCGGKTDAASSASPSSAGAGTGAKGAPKKEAKLEFKNLDKLGAKIEVPADTQITDASADAPAVALFDGSGEFSVDVAVTTEMYASDANAAKEQVKKDPNTFKKFTVEKVTADGWHLEFELESMMDKKPLYGVQVRKKIGDKQLECSRNVPSEAGRAAAAKACDSLTKL
ncbi:MAG: hypothetical protein U0414_24345 [Polyangiaceae bacterium]